MADRGLDRFRDALLLLVDRDILVPNQDKLPPILSRTESDDITTGLSRDQRLLADIFWGAGEIWESLEILGDIRAYLSKPPTVASGIPKSRHLVYHLGNYLQETYILQELVKRYSGTLKKKYSRGPQATLDAIDQARDVVLSTIKEVVEFRGTHVHEQRFNDPDLHRLSGYELILRSANIEQSSRVFASERSRRLYREQKLRWLRTVEDATTAAITALDTFFDALYSVLLEKSGEIRPPQHWPDT